MADQVIAESLNPQQAANLTDAFIGKKEDDTALQSTASDKPDWLNGVAVPEQTPTPDDTPPPRPGATAVPPPVVERLVKPVSGGKDIAVDQTPQEIPPNIKRPPEAAMYPGRDNRGPKSGGPQSVPGGLTPVTSTSGGTTTNVTQGPDTSGVRQGISEAARLSAKAAAVEYENDAIARKKLAFAFEHDPVLAKAVDEELASWNLYIEAGADKYDATKELLNMRKKQQEKYDQAAQEIDPNRFWADKEAWQKAAAGIAILMGGLGAALTGTEKNTALEIIDSAIKQDIAAQEFNRESARKDADRYSNTINQELAIRNDMMKNIYERYKISSDFIIKRMEKLKGKFTDGKQEAAYLSALAELKWRASQADLQAVKIGGRQTQTTYKDNWEKSVKDTSELDSKYWQKVKSLNDDYKADARVKLAGDSIFQADAMLVLLDKKTPLNDLQFQIKQSKLVDPTSAVLGSELYTQQNVGPKWEAFKVAWEQLLSGKMPESKRASLRKSVQNYVDAMHAGLQGINKFYRVQADERGIPYKYIQWVERKKKDYNKLGVQKAKKTVLPTGSGQRKPVKTKIVKKIKVGGKKAPPKFDNKKKGKVKVIKKKGNVKVAPKKDKEKGGN